MPGKGNTNGADLRPVTALRRQFQDNLQDPITELATALQISGMTPSQFARQRDLNHGMIHWLKECADAGRLRWSKALAGPGWQTITLAFKSGNDFYPDYIVSPFPPRQCDVTDRWFIPTDSRQRFAPGLSEAVKRAARRDLVRARQKYAQLGDWGR